MKEPLSIKIRRWLGLLNKQVALIYKYAQPIVMGVLADYQSGMSADQIRELVIREIKKQLAIEIPAVPSFAIEMAIDFLVNTVRSFLRQREGK